MANQMRGSEDKISSTKEAQIILSCLSPFPSLSPISIWLTILPVIFWPAPGPFFPPPQPSPQAQQPPCKTTAPARWHPDTSPSDTPWPQIPWTAGKLYLRSWDRFS